MSINYYGSFPCKVRQAVTDEELLKMEKARNRANAMLEIMRNDPQVDKSKPEHEWSFKIRVIGADGSQEEQVRISDLLDASAPLNNISPNCANCPTNIRSGDFGCGGLIRYPISAQAERWLISRLPADLNTRAGQLLTRAILDFHYDGDIIDRVRNRKELFQSDKPLERKWGGFFSKKTKITSSQILEMTFGVGSLQATHAKLIAYFLGFVNDGFSILDIPENRPQPGDDDGIIEMKNFFSVAAIAGANGASVYICK